MEMVENNDSDDTNWNNRYIHEQQQLSQSLNLYKTKGF